MPGAWYVHLQWNKRRISCWKKLAALYRQTAGLVIAKSKPIEEEVRDV
jgi:hypothetical protein